MSTTRKYIVQRRDHWSPAGVPRIFGSREEAERFVAVQPRGRTVSFTGRVVSDITWTIEDAVEVTEDEAEDPAA